GDSTSPPSSGGHLADTPPALGCRLQRACITRMTWSPRRDFLENALDHEPTVTCRHGCAFGWGDPGLRSGQRLAKRTGGSYDRVKRSERRVRLLLARAGCRLRVRRTSIRRSSATFEPDLRTDRRPSARIRTR